MNFDQTKTDVIRYLARWATIIDLMQWTWRNDIPTAATDGKAIFWSPKFWSECSRAQRLGITLHEAIHIAARHPMTKSIDGIAIVDERGPIPHLWRLSNVVFDHWLNWQVVDECNRINRDAGKIVIELPDDCLLDRKYRGQTIVEIWRDLYEDQPEPEPEQNDEPDNEENDDENTESQDSGNEPDQNDENEPTESPSDDQNDESDNGIANNSSPGDANEDSEPGDDSSGSGQPGADNQPGATDSELAPTAGDCLPYPGDANEEEEADHEIKDAIERAQTISEMAGNGSPILSKMAIENRAPAIKWQQQLAREISTAFRSRRSWKRLDRIYLRQDFLYPAKSQGLPEMAIYLDFSCSIDIETVNLWIAEINSLLSRMNPESATLISFTTCVHELQKIRANQRLKPLEEMRTGGTDFDCIIQDYNERNATLAIVLTDGWSTATKTTNKKIIWFCTEKTSFDGPGRKLLIETN